MNKLPLIYNKKLENIMINNRFITRKLKEDENLKLFHKYWINSFNTYVKVYDISVLDDTVYYYIKYDRMEGVISNPLEDNIYELYASNGIEEFNIINSNRSYTGAEIKYWFVVNRNKDPKDYLIFYKYLIYNKDDNIEISDNEYYNIIRYGDDNGIIISARKIP